MEIRLKECIFRGDAASVVKRFFGTSIVIKDAVEEDTTPILQVEVRTRADNHRPVMIVSPVRSRIVWAKVIMTTTSGRVRYPEAGVVGACHGLLPGLLVKHWDGVHELLVTLDQYHGSRSRPRARRRAVVRVMPLSFFLSDGGITGKFMILLIQ